MARTYSSFEFFQKIAQSGLYKENIIEFNIEPCGTPQEMGVEEKQTLSILTKADLSWR